MSEQIAYLPLNALRESPFNPRQFYDPANLAELSESIKHQGVMQPVVVRPLPDAQTDLQVRYELVFGHRRFRACQLLPEYRDETLRLPCIVRELDDEQAACAQVSENLQRADVSTMEHADSLARLHREHNLNARQLGARLGKSESYVYNRLKLAAACEAVRDAVNTGGLSPEVAIEVARLRGDKLQGRALQRITHPNGNWMSYRAAKEAIKGMFSLRLEAAPFDTTDAKLAKLAGACTTCPRRAGNDPDLVDDLPADVCTDAECYSGKVRTHARQQIARLKAEGFTVVTEDDARDLVVWGKPPHVNLRGHELASNLTIETTAGDVTADDVLAKLRAAGQPVPVPVYIQHPETGELMRCFSDEDAEALRDAGHEMARSDTDEASSTPSMAGASAQRGAPAGRDLSDWSEAERIAGGGTRDGRDAWSRVKRTVLSRLIGLPRTADDLRVMVLREEDQADGLGLMGDLLGINEAMHSARGAADDEFDRFAWLRAHLTTMTADQLGALVLGTALEDALGWGSTISREQAAEIVALAERYGVDVVAAARPEQGDDAGDAGGSGGQLDAFAEGTS